MTYDDWVRGVPEELRCDPVWNVEAYRLGLFASDLAWSDIQLTRKVPALWKTTDQLFRAAGAISADICEGYSRSTPTDRARFYEYALGSARETRDWYYKARHALATKVVEHRIKLASKVVALLVTMINNERKRASRVLKRKD